MMARDVINISLPGPPGTKIWVEFWVLAYNLRRLSVIVRQDRSDFRAGIARGRFAALFLVEGFVYN